MEFDTEIIEELKNIYKSVETEVDNRLEEFKNISLEGNDQNVFRELCFCILSSGVGPKVAEKSLEALGDRLLNGSENELTTLLNGVHKFPDKSSYLVTTREYLRNNFNFKLYDKLNSLDDHNERRDFIANNKGIKGIGYVQASHFLRNIGYMGYAILDKNIIKTMYEFGLIGDLKQPASKKKYIETEKILKEFSDKIGITIDKLDLLLWYRRTNKVPR